MQTFINRSEQNNDHMRIMRKTQFRSSFEFDFLFPLKIRLW